MKPILLLCVRLRNMMTPDSERRLYSANTTGMLLPDACKSGWSVQPAWPLSDNTLCLAFPGKQQKSATIPIPNRTDHWPNSSSKSLINYGEIFSLSYNDAGSTSTQTESTSASTGSETFYFDTNDYDLFEENTDLPAYSELYRLVPGCCSPPCTLSMTCDLLTSGNIILPLSSLESKKNQI